MKSITGIATGLRTLILFRFVLKENAMQELIRLDECDPADTSAMAEAYSRFTAALWESHDNLGKYVMDLMWAEENRYTRYRLTGQGNHDTLEALLLREAAILQQVARCDGGVYRRLIGDGTLPAWETDSTELLDWYRGRVDRIDQTGVGALVKMAAEQGRKTRPDIHLGICGEHGGDPSSIEFCHRIGLDYVSC